LAIPSRYIIFPLISLAILLDIQSNKFPITHHIIHLHLIDFLYKIDNSPLHFYIYYTSY
jgi:hypothetical protein